MSVWAEAWDLPHLPSPGKKVAYIPMLDYRFGRHADVFREEGAITVPAAFDRLAEVINIDPDDHTNDVGSVMHFYLRGKLGADSKPVPIFSYVVERRPDELHSPATSTTALSGRGLTSYFLDRVRLWAYDYPASPTKEDDWIFGGENILDNPGMEDGSPQSAQWTVWMEDAVASGTWKVNIGGAETAALDWDATTTEIGDMIVDDIPGLIAVSVTGSGTEDDPWIITVTDPSGDVFPAFTAVDIDLGPGAATLQFDTIRNGGGIELSGWEKSANLDRGGREHGRYASDGFRLTTAGEPVHSGLYALRVNGLSRYAGAMQVVNVIPGHRYTASIWARTGSATNIFRFVIRDRFEGFIGGPDGLGGRTLTPNTWTQFTYTFVAPTDRIIFRFAVVGDTVDGATVNPDPFYLDDGSLAPGVAATTIGDIWLQLWSDAALDHFGLVGRDALTWLVPSFDAALDSAGNAWDTARSLTLSMGDTYGQIAESIQRLWGYVHRIRFDREDNLYYYDVFNPGYVEFDHSTTDTGTLTVGMNILGGELVVRAPDATHFKSFTDEGEWAEDTDPDLLGPWGWADGEFGTLPTTDDGLSSSLVQSLARNQDQMVSFEFNMTDKGQIYPFVDFDVFHQLAVNLGDKHNIPTGERIVTSIVVAGEPGQAPDFQVFVNSDAFASTGAAALAEAVRRLLRRTSRKLKDFGGTVGSGGGAGVPRIVLGAINASDRSKAKSDWVSIGDDEPLFEDAMAEGAGEVRLTEGNFTPGSDLIVPDGAYLTGAGRGSSKLYFNDPGSVAWEFEGDSGMRFLSVQLSCEGS